jgi:flavin reductase (DIM6/NTAB) family NADH-FMN oxidoreductase RutF
MQIEGEEGEDPVLAFRRTLGMFATGVTVITTTSADQVHGMTANAFMSVSLRPPLVLISVDGRAKMHPMLNEGKRIGISVLSEDQESLSDRFAGRPGGTGPEPSFDVVRETPLVEGALAHLVARVTRSYWGGDHSLFLAFVEYAHYGQGNPLLFHGGHYEAREAALGGRRARVRAGRHGDPSGGARGGRVRDPQRLRPRGSRRTGRRPAGRRAVLR